jgi:hypothetical protein
MKSLLSVLTLVAIMTVGLAGCAYVAGGEELTMTYDLQDFYSVDAGSAFEVNVTWFDEFYIKVTAVKLDNIHVEKQGQTLKIWRDGNEWFGLFHPAPRVDITMPRLESLKLSGASRGQLDGFDMSTNLDVDLSGASRLDVHNLATGNFNLKVSGASKLNGVVKTYGDAGLEVNGASSVELNGFVRNLSANIGGASKALLREYYAQDASLVLSGASRAEVTLDGRLDARISGASNLGWRGVPTMGTIETSGGSSIHNL